MISKRSLIFFILAVVLIAACSKSSSPAPKPVTTGSFTFQSQTYNGTCTSVISGNNSSNINVGISGTVGTFFIYNMPKASTGSTAFTDGFDNINSATSLYAFLTVSPDYATVAGGSVTKTGSNTFT